MEKQDVIRMAPTLIQRWVSADHPGVMDISAPDGHRAPVVFMNPEQAEEFRTETGAYPDSEGFEVEAVDTDGLSTVTELWGFELVALRGPEPNTISFWDAEEFIEMLEEGDENIS